MSDAILTFQSQLSGVMETVFKAAMYEITRLVEDSFLEEVSRSREQVESLRQRLQWSESRRREREGGGRARCADCGRAGVPSEDTEDRPSGAQSGVDEGRGLKQEKVPEGTWSSCPGEVSNSNPGPPSAPEELAPSSPVRAPDMSATAPTGLEGGRPDSLLKEEENEEEGGDEEEEEVPREMDTGDNIQGTWLPRSEAGGGAHVAPPSTGCSEQEWSPGTRQDTAPPSGRLLPEQQQSVGETYGLYGAESEHEHVSHRLSLAGPQRSATRRDDRVLGRDVHKRILQAESGFTQESGSPEGPPAGARLQPDSDCLSPSRSLDAKPLSVYSDGLAIKQEVEAQSEWGQPAAPKDLYTQQRQHGEDRGGANVQADRPSLRVAASCCGDFSPVDSVTPQPREQGCGSLGKHTQIRLIDRTAVAHSPAAADKGACTSYSKALFVSKNFQTHPRAFPGDRRLGAAHFGRSVTQLEVRGDWTGSGDLGTHRGVGAGTLGNMSDAILTFQVQLSGVMETVLKSAMYEITRLVEDSFLEEVARSKQEVESLRQRLQWSESRQRERGRRAGEEVEEPTSLLPVRAAVSRSGARVRGRTRRPLQATSSLSSSRALGRPMGCTVRSRSTNTAPTGSVWPGRSAAPRGDDPHSEPGPWAEFKLGDIDNETDGLDPSYATEAEPASPSAQAEPQPAPAAEEGAGDSVSPLQYLNVKSEGGVGDSVAIKEEFEIQPVCTEEGSWDLAHTHHRRHRDTWDTGETQVESTAHSPPSQDAIKRLQTFSDKVESLTLQLRQRQQHGPPEKTPKTNVDQLSARYLRTKRGKTKSTDGQRTFSNVARQVLTQFQVWQNACYSKNIDWTPVTAQIVCTLPQLRGRETEVIDRCTKMLQNRREYLRRTGQVSPHKPFAPGASPVDPPPDSVLRSGTQ
ncbi:hypothetical protein AAFF_G00293460 [Aldrovandia affinis]|uniref:Uncharacterized protein n=1 Tax=Aldrovandia affinis TaxID=143900 RepID=A0AAD7W1A9_9TELE|nr:hypothetical protein AAFF_G00293460 [Aldrovandia affinis]